MVYKFQLAFATFILCGCIGEWASAQDYGFDFVTIGATGNPAYSGPDPTGYTTGRGSVDHEYRIGRLEVTTSQWLDFVNTFTTREDSFVGLGFLPVFWGAYRDPEYQGPGFRWRLPDGAPDAEIRPVAGITWRTAARYCNWLHNGQRSDFSSLDRGAYDTSTWGFVPGEGYTDAPGHEAGARFWIPTVDEWLKAAYYDPDRHGPGSGGYWNFPNSSDVAPIPGFPGEGETMAGYDPVIPFSEWIVPLGAYPHIRSPWGLLDTSGGVSEQLEDWFAGNVGIDRWNDGASAGQPGAEISDDIRYAGGLFPETRAGWVGLRVASAVPSCHAGTCMLVCVVLVTSRRRR